MDEKAIFILDLVRNFEKRTPRWSEISIRLCTVWRFCSPKGYQFCRDHLVKLPSKSSISRYLGKYGGQNQLISQRLCAEIMQLKHPVERIYSLIIDDMAIKQKMHYSRGEDHIYGLDTCGSSIIGDRPKLANKMLCFVVNRLSTRYTIPAGYFFHANLSVQTFHDLTIQVMQLLTDCGFIVLRLVTDNIITNVALFKKLCNGSIENQIDHPILQHIPLFLSFDFCHAMENMYRFFQIHNVSNRQQYIRSLDDNVAPYVHISDERLQWLDQTFQEYIDGVQNSSAHAGIQGLSKQTAHALKLTARSTCLCVKFLLEQGVFYYVLTRTFSSDAIEAMFSHVRLKGGSNDATDARTAEYALRQILRCGIVKASPSSNTAEKVTFVSSVQLTSSEASMSNPTLKVPDHLHTTIRSLQEIPPVNIDISLYSASVAYLAGYLHDSRPSFELIVLQDRGGLVYPNASFVSLVQTIANIVQSAIPFLDTNHTSSQLLHCMLPYLSENPIFSCDDHKVELCETVITITTKPILDNICLEATDRVKKIALQNKPLSRKVFKL